MILSTETHKNKFANLLSVMEKTSLEFMPRFYTDQVIFIEEEPGNHIKFKAPENNGLANRFYLRVFFHLTTDEHSLSQNEIANIIVMGCTMRDRLKEIDSEVYFTGPQKLEGDDFSRSLCLAYTVPFAEISEDIQKLRQNLFSRCTTIRSAVNEFQLRTFGKISVGEESDVELENWLSIEGMSKILDTLAQLRKPLLDSNSSEIQSDFKKYCRDLSKVMEPPDFSGKVVVRSDWFGSYISVRNGNGLEFQEDSMFSELKP